MSRSSQSQNHEDGIIGLRVFNYNNYQNSVYDTFLTLKRGAFRHKTTQTCFQNQP